MCVFFKDIHENGVVKDVCDIFKSINPQAITPIHMVALEALSTIICPVYGDFYSFPWKRGPHDSILEYIEASTTFDKLRNLIFNEIKGHDFVSKAMAVFTKEDENKNVEVRCSVLRFFVQFLQVFDTSFPKGDRAVDYFVQNNNFKNVIFQIAS